MNAFIDTNVSISYIFKIDSLNHKAKNVFREYENLYISDLVKEEIDEVFQEKRDILVVFFNELSKNLKSKKCIIISFKDLKDYLNQLDYTEEEYGRVKSSLKKFWFDYINESFPKNQIVQTGVSKCLNDLDIFIFSKKEEMENMVNITEKRRKKYNV